MKIHLFSLYLPVGWRGRVRFGAPPAESRTTGRHRRAALVCVLEIGVCAHDPVFIQANFRAVWASDIRDAGPQRGENPHHRIKGAKCRWIAR